MKPILGAAGSKRHASRRLKPLLSEPAPAIEQKWDRESGQVYSEVEVRFQKKMYSDWIRESKSPILTRKPRPNDHGARSLAQMANHKVATQFHSLSPEHFTALPWAMAEEVWMELLSMRGESFHAWRTLATAYPSPDEFGQPDHRYLLSIKQPGLPLPDYFAGVTSHATTFMTCLRISPKQLTTIDLVAIHKITNLAVLDLSDGQITIDQHFSKFDERTMRSWAEVAKAGQAFQHLRVILLGWQENLSDWIFKYVDDFPSLCHIIVTDCPRMHQKNRAVWEPVSQSAGWDARHAKRSAKSLRPVIADPDFHFGSVSGCFYESMELFGQLAHPRRPGVVDRKPLLEVWLGSPRQWSHIVDDFPANRTIFFENTKTQAWTETTAQSRTRSRDQPKRVRHHEREAHGPESPPPKRGPQTRPLMKAGGQSIVDVLGQFQT